MDFFFHKHVRVVRPENCAGCGACAKTCPQGAIMVLKRPGSSLK
ncbi:4Fe-4S binding protein [Desulfotruncus arcticus]|nr:4Fe-4S binding protein [Desulfotruncus arcticus]